MPTFAAPFACPICGTSVSPETEECPRCGEPFTDVVSEPVPREHATSARRERFLFRTGVVLILLGGPGIALGSWLHDVLRISFLNYDAFGVFGPMNELVLAAGLVVMIVGTVFVLLSLRFSRAADTEDLA